MGHIFDSKLHQSQFYVYENYVVYLHVYHVRSCSPTPTYKQPLYGCQPDEPQASLATINICNHVYVVLFFILLFMYAVIHYLYSVGNKITTTTTTTTTYSQSKWVCLSVSVDIITYPLSSPYNLWKLTIMTIQFICLTVARELLAMDNHAHAQVPERTQACRHTCSECHHTLNCYEMAAILKTVFSFIFVWKLLLFDFNCPEI